VAQALANGLTSGLAVRHAQVARAFEAGRVDKTVFASFELFEGRSVGALMARSQEERQPFAPDHALLIVSKAAAALEAAQARKMIHGFLVTEFIHVSHDGEVSVRGFGFPTRLLREANRVGAREARYLAPELDAATPLDIRADIFSLGAQLFEMLTGSALPRTDPTARSIDAARVHSPGGDGTPIPGALASLLVQALAEDPLRRFKDAASFKKAVDTLLFSGDYSPTTFNLAFFMHTLFRDEGDADAAAINAEKLVDYRPYLAAPAAVVTPSPALSASGLSHPASVPDHGIPLDTWPETVRPEVQKPDPIRHDSGRTARPVPVARPSGEEIFRPVLAEKKGFPVVPVVFGLVAVIAAAGYLLTRPGSLPSSPPAAPTMNPAETAALARVRELESRLAALEAEKAAAAQKASEEAAKTVEAQARARGRAVDPAELQKAQDAARLKAQADQEERVWAERQKLDEERRLAEEARAAEAAKAATPSPAATPTASPTVAPSPAAISPSTPTPAPATPTPTPTPSGPVLLDLADPGVVAPQLVSAPRIEYPPVARAQRITGTVLVSALVDEQGNVVETKLIRGVSATAGLNVAAIENIKKRKYKPATLNGKPGRAWIAIQIDFKF
jgi:TonB family protein